MTSSDSNINFKLLARELTVVENELPGANELLKKLDFNEGVPVIGITGPPGAGKSSLVNAIITELIKEHKKVAVLAVDPTSPFNFGSLLGDRIRMSSHFNHPDVFIRSVATRGSVGGLSIKTIEMADVLRSSGFDYVIIETVGVGQSEIDIAGLADVTLVVLVPGSGDEIQHLKSGLMEIADAFVVNKADMRGAEEYAAGLQKLVSYNEKTIPVYKTIATGNQSDGIKHIIDLMKEAPSHTNQKRNYLLAEKAYRLIQAKRMDGISKNKILRLVSAAAHHSDFNVYRFAYEFMISSI